MSTASASRGTWVLRTALVAGPPALLAGVYLGLPQYYRDVLALRLSADWLSAAAVQLAITVVFWICCGLLLLAAVAVLFVFKRRAATRGAGVALLALPAIALLVALSPALEQAVIAVWKATRMPNLLLTLEVSPRDETAATPDEVATAIGVLARRLSLLGQYHDPVPRGGARIAVYLSASRETDPGRVKDYLLSGYLTFDLVHEDSDTLAAGAAQPDFQVPPGYETAPFRQTWMVVRRAPLMTGTGVEAAGLDVDGAGRAAITLRLAPESAARFAAVTRDNTGRRIAIRVDGEVLTAPAITGPIEGDEVVISGGMSLDEAAWLAHLLSAGALPQPITVLSENLIDE